VPEALSARLAVILPTPGEARPGMRLLQPGKLSDRMGLSRFDTALVGLHRLRPILDLQAGVLPQPADILAQGCLITLARQDVIGSLVP
jgi:hypothetical protein